MTVKFSDIQAVIDSAKARGMEPLEGYLRGRFPTASEEEITDTAEVALEVIESIPIFLARANQHSRERHLEAVVQPLLDHAAQYFLQPVDLMPEMTMGLAGLLDDAYLVLRVLQNLEKGPERFLKWDLDEPIALLRGLIGERIARQLDAMALGAMQEVSKQLGVLWAQMSHRA